MVQLTERAVSKVREILDTQEPKPAGLRISVVGGGCSGFSYSMAFENQKNMLDKTYNFENLNVFIDQASLLGLRAATQQELDLRELRKLEVRDLVTLLGTVLSGGYTPTPQAPRPLG